MIFATTTSGSKYQNMEKPLKHQRRLGLVSRAHAVPGVQKLLVRVGNVEQKYEELNTRVESLESRDSSSSENVKEMILEEMTELKEIEGRRLNIIC